MNLNKSFHSYLASLLLLIFVTYGLPQSITAQKKSKPEAVITIEVSTGWTYYYTGKIYADGTVIFKGRGHGILNGVRKYKIPQTKVAELIAEFDRINFFSLDDNYLGVIDDGGSITTSISLNGRHKKIKNEFVHKELEELETKIINAADFARFYDAIAFIRSRLDEFLLKINADPTTKLTIISYGTAKQVAKAEARIRDHIKFRGYDMKRVKLVRRVSNRRIKIDYQIAKADTKQN